MSFVGALKYVLRQDPDVILIGEMRDLETISACLTAAETGHLVLATLHTNDAAQTIDRIIDVFPPHQQSQIRTQLAAVLLSVISQQLIPTANGEGRALAVEIMVNTPAIANLIREAKTHQVPSVIETSTREGMQSRDKCIKELYMKGIVAYDEALRRMKNPGELMRMME
jgi:twitching motility protein PilT